MPSKQMFKHTLSIACFIVKRDRIRIPIWIIAIALITFSTAVAFTNLYQTQEERQAIAETMENPAMTAMVGQGYGIDNYTNGAMMAHQMLLFTAIAVAIMSILLVVRHTRADEDDGQIELIRSLPVGRLSNIGAAMLVVSGTNVLIAIIIGFGLYALGIESMDLQGSLLYGAGLGVTGIIFAAITALFAQLSESSRGTLGMSFSILIVAYIVRSIGDVGNYPISWFSPLGIVLGTEVYVNNYWWPIFLIVGIAVIFVIIAFYLNSIRDLEAGFIASKPGRKHASAFLLSPLGLAFRIQRTGLIAWAIGMLLLGSSYGSVLGDLESFFKDVEIMESLIAPVEGFTLTEQFLPMIMTIMAMFCTVPALMIVFKLKGEEKRSRTEHLLSRVVSRSRIMGSYFILALIISFVMLLMTIIGLWAAGVAVMDDAVTFRTMFEAGMAFLPAIWVMIGVSMLLVGFAPQLTGIAWLYFVYSFVVVYLGRLLQFPDWMTNLSPYGHIPQLPVDEMDFASAIVLTATAILLMTAGFTTYKKRDILG